jgi:DNA-binding MarR family transcriptional regulator
MNHSTSILHRLLFNSKKTTHPKGRLIRFDESTPDIAYTTGSMRERVILFLQENQGFATTSEVAKGIASNPSRTTTMLNQLVAEGVVNTIKLEGCVREYELKITDKKTASVA